MTLQAALCARIAATLASAPIHDHLGYEALAFLKLPGPDYRAVLATMHAALKPKLYVEIGVRDGASLKLAGPDTRCIAIDPQPRVNIQDWPNRNTSWNITTSDRFFERQECVEKAKGFDLGFIDGDHSYGQVMEDFSHLEALAKPSSIIAIHDVIPMDERTAQPSAEGVSFHSGDVWRAMATIVEHRPDLTAFTVPCAPTGLGIVGRFGQWQVTNGFCPAQLDMNWDVLTKRLNIVENSAAGIARGFHGERAA